MAGAGQGVAVLVVLDALCNSAVQTRARFWIEVPTLDQGIGHEPHLADCPLGVFPPAVPGTFLPGTGS